MKRLNLVQSRITVSPCRVVSILSGKGGVGKSVLAFNLAERLAAIGARVLIVDADFACGNQHILANAPATTGLEAYVGRDLSLAQAVTPVADNLDLLACPTPVPQMAASTDAAKLIARLHADAVEYDVVVLDHASGVSNFGAVMAYGSDLNLIVLVPELTSIADAYGLYKFLVKSGDTLDCRLLLNRVADVAEAEHIHTKFAAMAERFLDSVPSLAGSVQESDIVRQAVAAQAPLAGLGAESVVAQNLSSLAEAVRATLVRPISASGAPEQAINKTTAAADTRG